MFYNKDDDDNMFTPNFNPFCPFCKNNPANKQPNPFGPPPPPFNGAPGNNSGNPPGPPPKITPKQQKAQGPSLKAVDPGAIMPCKYRYVYLWLKDKREFWAWLTFIGPKSASGFKWKGYRWVYFGVDLNEIESFECY